MSRYDMIVAVMGQICGTALIITLATLWFQRRKDTRAVPRDVMQRVEQRLTEVQQSLDAVAVEVERISEGQRFTTKLLAERGIAADAANSVRESGRGSAVR